MKKYEIKSVFYKIYECTYLKYIIFMFNNLVTKNLFKWKNYENQ